MRNYSRLADAGRRGAHARHQSEGFTLVELLAVMAILAIILASTPILARVIRQAQVQASFHALSSSLALARISAVSRGHPVTLCPSSDGAHCTGGTVWSGGWIVYRDAGRRSQPASPEDIVETVSAVRGGIIIRTSPGRLRIRYHPSGWASGSNLSLTLCAASGTELAGKVVVNNAGRPRIERASPGLPCS